MGWVGAKTCPNISTQNKDKNKTNEKDHEGTVNRLPVWGEM